MLWPVELGLVAAAIAAGLLTAAAAQASDLGTCIAKSDVKRLLGDAEGQVAVAVASQGTVINGELKMMQVTFTTNTEGKGYVLEEYGCASPTPSVKVAMVMKDVKVFDYAAIKVPTNAYIVDDRDVALTACHAAVLGRSRQASVAEMQQVGYGQELNEALSLPSTPFYGCTEHNKFLDDEKAAGRGDIMLEGKTVLKDGTQGNLLSLFATSRDNGGNASLTTANGVLFPIVSFSSVNPTKNTAKFVGSR